MRKSHFNDEFLVLLGPIISRFFACSNEEKKPKQQRVRALVLSLCLNLAKADITTLLTPKSQSYAYLGSLGDLTTNQINPIYCCPAQGAKASTLFIHY
jgi:hypothetical protein